MYVLSSIIISLFPLNIALRIALLLSCSLDEVSDVGTLLDPLSLLLRPTRPSRDCLRLALGLSGRSR